MSNNAIPPYRLDQYYEFLLERGIQPHNATAIDKMAWLGSLLSEPNPPRYGTFRQYGYQLSRLDLGSRDPEDGKLVRAFVLEFRRSRLLPAPVLSSRAMPGSVFKAMIELISSKRKGRGIGNKLFGPRIRTALKLLWCTGIYGDELRELRRKHLTERASGFEINVPIVGRALPRTIPIPYVKETAFCAASELAMWLDSVPLEPKAYVFPLIDIHVREYWDKPVNYNWPMAPLKYLLAKLHERRYDILSIRRSFLKRSMERLGAPATFYLSGFTEIMSLYNTLRQEPDWSHPGGLLD